MQYYCNKKLFFCHYNRKSENKTLLYRGFNSWDVYFFNKFRGKSAEVGLEEMFPKCKSLDLSVRMEETISWVKKKLGANNQEWSESVTERVAWGILAALRDFGILEGTKKKKVAPVYLPLEAFAYIAFSLYKLGSSGERLVNHPDWKLFLIDTMVVERLFLEAHQNKMLHYQSAGKIYRIEFPENNWEGMADVISGRAN